MADEKSYKEQYDKGVVKAPERTLAEAERGLQESQKALGWENKSWSIQAGLFPVMNKDLELITPDREFQNNPEFWVLQRELQVLEHEKAEYMHLGRVKQLNKAIEEREKVVKELKGE